MEEQSGVYMDWITWLRPDVLFEVNPYPVWSWFAFDCCVLASCTTSGPPRSIGRVVASCDCPCRILAALIDFPDQDLVALDNAKIYVPSWQSYGGFNDRWVLMGPERFVHPDEPVALLLNFLISRCHPSHVCVQLKLFDIILMTGQRITSICTMVRVVLREISLQRPSIIRPYRA